MESINNLPNFSEQPPVNLVPSNSKPNIYKYLFFVSIFILLGVIISLIFVLKTRDIKTSPTKQEISTPTPSESTTKIRVYSYKSDPNIQTDKTFTSLTSDSSLGQMYVDLILEDEDVSSFGMGTIKNFILNLFNKQVIGTFTGSYTENNGKITLNFEHKYSDDLQIPSPKTFVISEDNVVIDGFNLIRNDNLVKVYDYSAAANNPMQKFTSFNNANQAYVRLILVSKPEIPKDFFPGIYLFSTFNKQERQLYSGQYSLDSNNLTLHFYDVNKKAITTLIKDSSVLIDNIELTQIK